MFAIEDQGLILDATKEPPERRIAYFTSLCPLESGTMLCGFQNGPAKHAVTSTIGLCRSTDGGRTWIRLPISLATTVDGVTGSLAAAEMVETAPGKLLLFATWFDRSDPERPLFDPVTEGILKSKQLVSVSGDEGNTWSAWRELNLGDLRGSALTGPIVKWADGTIGFPFESFKEFDDPRPARHGAWLLVSRDGGETFDRPLLVAQHPRHEAYYWDQRLCAATQNGQFVAMFWTHDLAQKRDLNVHKRHGRLEGGTISAGPIRETSIPGQIAAPCLLKGGRLAAFVVDRVRPSTMSLWISFDGGATWPSAQRLVVYAHDERALVSQGSENVDFAQYWEDMGKWSFGHPAIRKLDDERLLLAWYAGSPDCMSLHWARVRVDEGAPR